MEYKKIPEQIRTDLKTICDEFDREDIAVRERQIRLWKKLDFYWAGFQRIYWDDVAHDWRVLNSNNDGISLNEAAYYDKPINVFRAYLETIIAALSATVPTIKCAPEDADNTEDITTATGGTKIAELVYNHIDAQLLWVRALYVYCTQGNIFAYNYSKESKAYGEVEVNETENEEKEIKKQVCPLCGTVQTPEQFNVAEALQEGRENEFDPGDEDVEINDVLQKDTDQVVCVNCQAEINPEIQKEKIIVQRIVGKTKVPKSRQCIEVLGGLFVKVPNWARSQDDIPYLRYSYETHFTNVLKDFPDVRKELLKDGGNVQVSQSSGGNHYERWGRLNTQYLNQDTANTPTVNKWWLRPSAYEVLSDENAVKDLKKHFPNGCHVVFVNDIFAGACNEDLDDHWTIVNNPISNYITYDPLGTLLTSIQEITQDLIALTLQTIEQGVGQTFADPQVLNFQQYQNTEVMPGAIIQAKAKSGKSLAEGFHTIKTASLGQEVPEFGGRIQELGQFVSGATPSLFGGAGPANQRTAGQQSLSLKQSLQRLQTPWKMINLWWKNVFGKVIPQYIKNMLEDEKIVREQHGSFINDFIKMSQVQGKIGNIILSSGDELPQTWAQKRDLLMQLMQLNNPEILKALGAPENLGILSECLGLEDFSVPGEMDREKQLKEITELLRTQPIPGPDGNMMPSVMPEFLVDNHAVEAEITRIWLVSQIGMLTKVENPGGYENVKAHHRIHVEMMMQKMQGPPPSTGAENSGSNNEDNNGQGNRPAPKLKPIS